MTNPPLQRISVELSDSVRQLFVKRARQHVFDSYAGITLMKFPESLRIYEHLLWSSNANTVIELGGLSGGSALWLRDRLACFARYKGFADYHVYSVDKDISSARNNLARVDPEFSKTITLIEGDVTDPQVAATLTAMIAKSARTMVIEDSAHTYETTRAALHNFASFVAPRGFYIVEDTYLDDDVRNDFGADELEWDGVTFGGMRKAIDEWALTMVGQQFRLAEEWQLYGISGMPRGIFERVR